MQAWHTGDRRRFGGVLGVAVAGVALTGLLAGCGGSSGGGSGGATPTPTINAAEAKQQVAQNWETFFDASQPINARLPLLQGSDSAGIQQDIQAQSKNPQAKGTSAKVTKVVIVPASQSDTGQPEATVTYNILIKGAPVLKGSTGKAVYVNGQWLVSTQTFCSLLELGAKNPNQPIPGCTS